MQQLLLPFEQPANYTLKEFIVSTSNEAAYKWLLRWPEWSHFSLTIYGEKGCGKTHLSSIWQAISKAQYLKAEDFNAMTFERLFEKPYIFILDDAHLIENEEKFFHFYNHLMSKKGNLLLLSKKAPAHWGMDLPDLRSRLNAIPAIKIHLPDENLLTQVIQKQFTALQLNVDEAVITFLLTHMERTFESAHFWISVLNQFAMIQKRSISVAVVREILTKIDLVGKHL